MLLKSFALCPQCPDSQRGRLLAVPCIWSITSTTLAQMHCAFCFFPQMERFPIKNVVTQLLWNFCVCHCLQQVPSNKTTATREPPSSRPPEMLAQSDSNQNSGKRAGVLHCSWQLRSSIHHCNGKFTQIFKASHPHKGLQIEIQHRAYKQRNIIYG